MKKKHQEMATIRKDRMAIANVANEVSTAHVRTSFSSLIKKAASPVNNGSNMSNNEIMIYAYERIIFLKKIVLQKSAPC